MKGLCDKVRWLTQMAKPTKRQNLEVVEIAQTKAFSTSSKVLRCQLSKRHEIINRLGLKIPSGKNRYLSKPFHGNPGKSLLTNFQDLVKRVR